MNRNRTALEGAGMMLAAVVALYLGINAVGYIGDLGGRAVGWLLLLAVVVGAVYYVNRDPRAAGRGDANRFIIVLVGVVLVPLVLGLVFG